MSPAEPPIAVQETFLQFESTIMRPPRHEPALWVKILCEHRDELQGLILGPSFEAGEMVYRFLFASQNRRIVFQLLHCLDWKAGAASNFGEGSLIDYADKCHPKLCEISAALYCTHVEVSARVDQDDLLAFPASMIVHSNFVAGLGLQKPLG